MINEHYYIESLLCLRIKIQGLSWIDFVDFDIICDRHFDLLTRSSKCHQKTLE